MPKSRNRKKKQGKKCSFVEPAKKYRMTKQRLTYLIKKMSLVCKAAGAPHAIAFFSFADFRMLNLSINMPMQVEFDEESSIDEDHKKFIRSAIKDMLSTYKISYTEDAEEISLYDHYIFGETLAYLFRSQNGYRLTFIDELKKELHHFHDFVNERCEVDKFLDNIFLGLNCYLSTPTTGLFNFSLSYGNKFSTELVGTFRKPRFYRTCVVSIQKPITNYFNTRNGRRLGYQLIGLLPKIGVTFFKFPPSLYHLHCEPIVTYDFYISSHAMYRVAERIDCIDPRLAIPSILPSIMLAVCNNKLDLTKHRMFPFSVNDVKLGYMVYEIIDQCIYIKTFLFLTNEGTPEGNALSERMGFSKLDKKYWNLGKLSTFFETDIYNVPEMKQILEECGCDHLTDVRKVVRFEEEHFHEIANKILDYMSQNTVEPDYEDWLE